MPLVSARASVWQEPHLATNCLLAGDQVGVVAALDRAARRGERERGERAERRRARREPAQRAARARYLRPVRACVRLMSGRNTIRTGGCLDGRSRARHAPAAPVSRASAGSSSSPRAAAITPRATPSHDQRSRTVATRPLRARSRSAGSAVQPAARHAPRAPRTAPSSTGKDSRPATSAGTAAASASLTSARPGVGGADGQRAAGGRLGGDHPERLRERARHDQRLARRQQLGELLVLEAAGEHDALAQRAARRRGSARAPRPREAVEEREQVAQRPRARRPSRLQRAPGPRDRPRPLEVAGRQRARAAARSPRGRRRSRRPRAARAARARARAARRRAAGRRPC